MTKRQALRAGVLAIFGMVLGKIDAVSAKEGTGLLTCDLNQWRTIRFTYQGETLNVPVGSIFAAIKEGMNGKN